MTVAVPLYGRGRRFIAVGPTLPLRGRARLVVGNAIYHTVGDREQAVKQLGLEFDQLYAELAHKIGVLPYEGSGERVKQHPAEFMWWTMAAVPMFNAWKVFKGEQTAGGWTGPTPGYIAYGERFATDWSVYEDWHKRLLDLRAGAKRLGIKLATPEPAKLPTTVIEDVGGALGELGGKVAGGASDVWTLAKVAVYGGLGVVGVIALSSVFSHLRSGTDPAAPYFNLAKSGTKAARLA